MDIESKIEKILSSLTQEQKAALLHGCDSMSFGNIPESGIPKVTCADGPQGVRLEDGTKTTALPCGMALAATWNPETAATFGGLIAVEARANHIHASLGPGINLMRTPLNGRNFEYYGEAPVLAGKIASGYIRGCQANGVAATPKHLALNNQEICRTTGNSICDKKTLRELYLEAFEIVIKEAHPWMIMSSYNRVNGEYASECAYTQQQFCKDECGFDGVMVSDWGATHAAKEALRGGLDLEMGGSISNWLYYPLLNQLSCHIITEQELDDHVRRVLRLIFRVTENNGAAKAQCATSAHGKVSRNIACESSVLLKNDGILPFNPKQFKRILVCGPSADFHHYTDLMRSGGSGAVHPKHEVTALEAIRARLGKNCVVDYVPGIIFRDAQLFPDELLDSCTCEFFNSPEDIANGKKPFLKETYNTLNLHWGIAFAAGINNTNEKLINRTYAIRLRASFTPKKSETWQIGLLLARFTNATLAIDGKCILDTNQSNLLDNSAKIAVKAGKQYTLEITGYHHIAEEDCDCKLLLRPDLKQMRKAALEAAKKADCVLYIGGSNHHYDREAVGWGDVKDADIPSLDLPDEQSGFISQLAKTNPNIIVSLLGGTVMDVEPWIDSVKAVVDFWYPGQECGNVIVDILTGAAAPEGHLPFTWAKRLNDYACHANGNYPGVREGTRPEVRYDEGIFIGYRHFDRAGITPRFPFGFGLSYTEYAYSSPSRPKVTGKLKDKSLKIVLSGKISNMGKRAGQALVQLYVCQPNCKHEQRPLKVLRNFAKVALKPGETTDYTMTLSWRDFAFFSPEADAFIAEEGTCQLLLADGQSNIVAQIPVTLKP